MLERLTVTRVAAAIAFFAMPALAEAQDGGRLRVLVPYWEAREGAERNFGEQASEDLREAMRELPFHVAVDEDDMEDQAERFNMELEDMNCLTSIQLATQLNIPVLICASYTQDAQRNFTVNASIRTIPTDEFVLPPFTVPRNGRREAAQQIIQQFERYNTLVRSAQICRDYAASSQWADALRNCDESLAINPNAMTTLALRARILFEMERREEALEAYDKVLALDPLNEDALQTAGYLATNLGDDERGRGYYRRYLDVNPGNAAVRMRIASQMAEAGDPTGAMEFIQPGLDVDPNNLDLLQLFGSYAFMCALDIQQQQRDANNGQQPAELDPAAATCYRQAIETFEHVASVQGNETTVDLLRNIAAAQMQLGDYPATIAAAERVTQRFPDDVASWNILGEALARSERVDEAMAAFDKVVELQPDHPTARLRKATLQIARQDLENAVVTLQPTATTPQSADAAASMIFNEAYQNGTTKGNHAYTVRGMIAAKQIPNISQGMREQLNFWHAMALFQDVAPRASEQNLAVAQATLPRFQEVQQLFNQAGNYPQTVGMNMTQTLQALATYIEIQEMIIRRGY